MMAAFLICGLLLAAAAPWIVRRLGNASGFVLALGPATMFGLLLARLGAIGQGPPYTESWTWVEPLGVTCSFFIDGLSLLFALLISGIGTLITLYAGRYLQDHEHRGRFFFWLLFFLVSMLGVVTADHVIMVFVFWELTSITSYFLIGFDHDREPSRAGALQALLVTGCGGLALLAGLILMSGAGGADTLSDLIHQGDRLRDHGWYPAILALVALGAFTKSAQTPFHFWLPNAMEAPTPVSAFLHSSTMVKAGVYLLARLQPALGGTQAWFLLLTSVGLATLLTGAAMALRQTVLKKLLAYSTISALGLLVMLTGLIGAAPAPAAGALAQAFAVFLLAHALYKAALFLVAGSLTHETGHKTVTGLAGLRRAMPWTAATALAAGLSMAGLPPLLGFVAKEAVLAAGLDWSSSVGIVAAVAVAAAGSGFVVVALLIAWTPFAGRRPEALTAHEAPPAMLLGPAILAALSLAAGLWPALIAEPVAFPAAEALTGHLDHHGHLALWHGFNAPLLLSVLSLAAGWLFWRTRRRWQPAYSALLDLLHRVGPEAGYTAALSGLLGFARLQTRMLQSGLLRFYLMFVVGFMALLSTAALARSLPVVWTWYPDPVRWPEFTLRNLPDLLFCLVILGGTAGTVHARSRLSAIAGLGSVGYGVGLLYVRFGAPDLAITQILVETLTLILFVLVFYHLRATPHLSKWSSRLRDSIIAAAGGAVMTAFVLATYRLQSFPSISPWFTEHAVPDGKGHNVVNVILVDFRSLDTLGEITVLGVGALGVYALLKLRPSPRPCNDIRL